MTEKLDPRRALIEINSMNEESQLLWPILTEQEKEEKRRENSQRAGLILLREIERLKSDAYEDVVETKKI